MAILKSEIRNKYTTIPNSVINDKELTDGDYRLLIYLYSLPNKWKINQGYLATQMNCNRRNISSKLQRIKKAGYLEIIKSEEDSSDYIYLLKEKGTSVNDVSVDDVSVNDVLVDDVYINTNIINTKKINTNINSKKEKSFTKPTLEDLTNYCNERNNNVNPQQFLDYYESNGWKVGRNSMKDWKATVRTWERNNFDNQKSSTKKGNNPFIEIAEEEGLF